jgi:hypothetical protein
MEQHITMPAAMRRDLFGKDRGFNATKLRAVANSDRARF